MSHSREPEDSWTVCVTRAWECAVLVLEKGGVEITPTVPGWAVVRDRKSGWVLPAFFVEKAGVLAGCTYCEGP